MAERMPQEIKPTTTDAVNKREMKPDAMITEMASPPFICRVWRHANRQKINPTSGHEQRPTAGKVKRDANGVHG